MARKPWMRRFYCMDCDSYFTDMTAKECPVCESNNIKMVITCGDIQ